MKVLFLSLFVSYFVKSHIVSLDGMKLIGNNFINKGRFAFMQPLGGAEIELECKYIYKGSFESFNHDGAVELVVAVVDSDMIQEIELGDINESIIDRITFLENITVEDKASLTNQTIPITKEGVYYMIIGYSDNEELHPNEQHQSSYNPKTMKDTDPYIAVSGQIVFKNTYGYLSAEIFPNLEVIDQQQFLLYLTIFQILIVIIWIAMMNKYKQEVVTVHKFITCVLIVALLDYSSQYIDLDIYNTTGYRNIQFVFISSFFNVSRNTIARVLLLLVSLGYGIRRYHVDEHLQKIAILTFLYFISHALYVGAMILDHYLHVSTGVLLMAAFPIFIFNVIFLYWIISSLKTTVSFLKKAGQSYKSRLVKRFYSGLIIGVLCAVILVILELLIEFLSNRDRVWSIVWIFQCSWFFVFSGIVWWSAFVLRPNDKSSLLATGEQLNEENTQYNTSEISRRGSELKKDIELENIQESSEGKIPIEQPYCAPDEIKND